MRIKYEALGKQLDFKMWCFPYLTYVVIALITLTLGYMFVNEKYQYETIVTLVLAIGTVSASFIVKFIKNKSNS